MAIRQPGNSAIRSSGLPDYRVVLETMAKNFRIISYSREGKITLELVGEIDGSSAAEVCWKLQELGIRECSMDFSRVKVIDLFGARVLARGLKSLRDRGVRFEVEALPERVAEKLCLGGILEALV